MKPFLLQKTLEYGTSVRDSISFDGNLYIAFSTHLQIRDTQFNVIKTIYLAYRQLVVYKNQVFGLLNRHYCSILDTETIELDQIYDRVVVIKDSLVFISKTRIIVMNEYEIKFSRNIVSEMIDGVWCGNNDICLLSRNGIEYYKCDKDLKPYKSLLMDLKGQEDLKIYAVPNSKSVILFDGNVSLLGPDIKVSKPFKHYVQDLLFLPLKKRSNDIIQKAIFCTFEGEYFTLKMYENDFTVEYLTKFTICTKLTLFQDLIFVGSHFHDSFLCKLQDLAAQVDLPGIAASHFEIVDEIPSLAPLNNLIVGELILCTSNVQPSCMGVIQKGIPINLYGQLSSTYIPTRISSLDDLLLLSYNNATKVLQLKNEELNQISHDLEFNEPTIFCAKIGERVIQVVPTGVYEVLHAKRTKILQINVQCCTRNKYLYVFGGIGNDYVVFKLDTTFNLVYTTNVPFSCCTSDENNLIFSTDDLYKTDLNFQEIMKLSIPDAHSLYFDNGELYVGFINGTLGILKDDILERLPVGNTPVQVSFVKNHLFVLSDSSYIYDKSLIKLSKNITNCTAIDDMLFFTTRREIAFGDLGKIKKRHLHKHYVYKNCLYCQELGQMIVGVFSKNGDLQNLDFKSNYILVFMDKANFEVIYEHNFYSTISCFKIYDGIITIGSTHNDQHILQFIKFEEIEKKLDISEMEIPSEAIIIRKIDSFYVVALQTKFLIILNKKIIFESDFFTHIVAMDTFQNYILIGDMIRSIFIYRLDLKNGNAEQMYRDRKPKWLTTAQMIDENHQLVCDDRNNVYMLEMSNNAYLKIFQGHCGGDTMNTLFRRPENLSHPIFNGRPVYYGTVGGSFGLFAFITDAMFIIAYLTQEYIFAKIHLKKR
eukprot:NODE_542_length_6240_cov_0.603485.p2 type:complete len:875 gc:universal NODE_542_length_6240_cov_0.603485:2744-120(-)